MKKICLLSAAACMFAISANASDAIPGDNSGWGTLNAGIAITAELVHPVLAHNAPDRGQFHGRLLNSS